MKRAIRIPAEKTVQRLRSALIGTSSLGRNPTEAPDRCVEPIPARNSIPLAGSGGSARLREGFDYGFQLTHAGWNPPRRGAAVTKDAASPRRRAEVAARQRHRPETLARRGFRQEPVVHVLLEGG